MAIVGQVPDQVAAPHHAGGAAALEDSLGRDISAYDIMGLEKGDRKKGDLFDPVHIVGLNASCNGKGPVDGILFVLVSEDLKRQLFKTPVARYLENFISGEHGGFLGTDTGQLLTSFPYRIFL